MENLLERAFKELYPDKFGYTFTLNYGNMHGYNGRIKMRFKHIECDLSKKWQPVSDDIQIGMIQLLILRIFRDKAGIKKSTINIDLYNSFVRNLHLSVPKTKIDAELKASFDRVNEKYFENLVEISNLIYAGESNARLGSYNYKTDTIKISNIFRNLPLEQLDYVMYHEMLHKKHKFYEKNGRSFHHTSAFRKDEKKFENSEKIEAALKRQAGSSVARKRQKTRQSFFDWF